MGDAKKYVVQFDSTTSMLYSLSGYLRGKDFPGVGVAPDMPAIAVALVNALPKAARQGLYSLGGWKEALPSKDLSLIRSEEISEYVAQQYPAEKYPAVFVGSSNGAAVHLAAAVGAPWLPQTFLVASRRRLHPDRLAEDLEWGREAAKEIARSNPDLQINQMHDPLQDRLMVALMAYFRLKKKRLGASYERFLLEKLEPGGTIFTVECDYRWPVARIGGGHYFQIGGLGGLTGDEYLAGGSVVSQFLEQHRSHARRWDAPAPTESLPESEWGFLPEMGEDIERFAALHGFKVRRIKFEHPEALSPIAADFYREWYAAYKRPTNRLVVECFALLEPWWCAATSSVPFWMAFNTGSSLKAAEAYVDGGEPFDEIFLMMMCNGVDGIDLTPISGWKRLLARGRKRGEFLGMNEDKYPMDFGAFVRYHADFKKKIADRFDPPPSVTPDEMGDYLERAGAAAGTGVTCV